MEHWELVQEMPHVEQMSTQERLQLARRRRGHQLKIWTQKEKEYMRRPANKAHKSNKRHIFFNDSVVLLEAAARNDIDEVRRLLMKGVSPDSCNEDGLTALHQCCIDDNEAMLQLLLEYGANVNAEDSEKWTPLHAAATCGHLRLVKCLIARGANLLAVNADGNMPYDICEDESTLDYIESEMAHRGVTQQLIDETRAHTEMQMLADLQRIATQNGDLEGYDHQGATPLHIAAANGYISVVEFLLDHHVSTDVKDRDEWQPAHAAACWGHLEVLEMLVHAGADLNAKNKHDETPADICEDPELRERIIQLKSEQESKRQAEAQRKRVRRSQSNTRAQSVRRTSLRDKTLTTKKDAVEEARLRLQAQEGYENPDSAPPPEPQNNNNNNNNNSNNNGAQSSVQPVALGPGNPEYDKMALANTENRKAPEGKDNDSLIESSESKDGQKESTYTTDANGKINVTVFVTINGTLADLKKQRAQIRNSSTELNSITTPISSLPESDSGLSTSPLSVHRFSGNTGDVVGDTRSKRCCVIQ